MSPSPELRKFVLSGKAQGTTFQVIYYATDSLVTAMQLDSIFLKIDSSLSLYKPYSLINRFNASQKGTSVDNHFLAVMLKSLSTYRETEGTFDVTVQPLVQAWGFGVTRSPTLPDSTFIAVTKGCVGSDKLRVYHGMVIKKKPCVKVDFNGIAQGYTVDLLAGVMNQKGITNYMIELGGEIRVKGRRQPGNEKMKIGIESPAGDEFAGGNIQKIITLDHGAITTSGNYRRFYESGGKVISHLIDPRTGYPVDNELISVTVYAEDAMTADAVDNALMVMGLAKGMAFIEKRGKLAAHFIYKTRDGTLKDTMSRKFHQLVQ